MLATMPYLFPSVAWFEALAARTEEGPHAANFRRFGVIDTVFAVRVGEHAYRLTFDGYGCTEAVEWDGASPVDFVIEASLADWRELIDHVRDRGTADGTHTLNSLVLGGDRFRLSGDDQLGVDNFYRYNPTLQAFIELAGTVPTIHRVPAP